MKFEALDAKDTAVLSALDINSRLTYSQIARQVKLSKQTVEYRVNSLQRRNIIKRFTPIIDYETLGYHYYRVYLQLTGLAPDEEEKFLQNIYSLPRVRRISRLDGTWDCAVAILSKDPYGVRQTLDEIQANYGSKIKSKMVLISTYCEMYTHKFLNTNFEMIRFPSMDKNHFEIDELDKGILNALNENARYSLIEMSSKLGVSYKVISYRIKRLEKSLIRAYGLELNYPLLGLGRYRVFVELQNHTKEKQEELIKFLRGNKNISSFTRTIGKFDMEFNCITSDSAQFHNTLTDFRSKFSDLIKDYSMCIISENLMPAKIQQFTF